VATFRPGFGDNSIFNLLRLQPGILAAGEQTNDLIILGGYEGHSMVVFDGFTIYSLKNFNDNISSFNPLMAKDIEVFKGGYDARYGERVSGIVNITGKNGNTVRPAFSININNMTMNGQVEIPIAKRGSLIIALRHTYYELYNPSDVNSMLRRNNDNSDENDVIFDMVPRPGSVLRQSLQWQRPILLCIRRSGQQYYHYKKHQGNQYPGRGISLLREIMEQRLFNPFQPEFFFIEIGIL
jgi:outer membrane receptor protein involved in Fe transport